MKTVVITGGTSGIGLALVNYFAKQNYRVIFTGRNAKKAKEIKENLADFSVEFFESDFASFQNVVATANAISAKYPEIDILINNAGVWEMAFKETQDDIETNLAVNHLSPMLFTLKLLPNINRESGRIVNTSSGAHRRNILDLDDMEWRNKPYDGVATYSQSKLLNIYFTEILANQLKDTGILVNTVHPGYVKTELFNNMGTRNWENVPAAFEGARSAIFAATSPAIRQSKLYIYQEGIDANITSVARDSQLARQVWDKSKSYLNAYL